MRRTVLVGLLALCVVVPVGAFGIYFYYHPSEGGVKTTELTEYLDGVEISNGTTISFPTDMEPGQSYSKNYSVENTGASVVSVVLRIEDLPSGWSLTWDGNNTALNPGQAAVGDLVLTVGSGAADGSYYWKHYLEAVK
jgi:uncharacterized membrane protein